MKNWKFRFRILCLLPLAILSGALSTSAGVSREIQEQYKRDYENKAMFLKIPIYTERQMIYITGQGFRIEQGSGSPRHRVGDQIRILLVDFGGDEIRIRMGGISNPGSIELGFKFDADLQETFSNREVFDRALQSTLTEGLKYTDIEDAKRTFVRDQFERAVREIAGSSSTSRESVLKNIAPQVPAYQDAQREIENLRGRVQEIAGQLSQSQSANRKLESELRAQEAELARLKNANASLQSKIEAYTSQISRLGEEVKDAKGSAQGYQRELANIQRSLNLRVDANRDLTKQISDLGLAMKKLQKDNESLTAQVGSLQTNLDSQQAANARLVADNEELKTGNRKLQRTIATLTSKEDSLAKQYVNLRNEKDRLDDYAQAVRALRTRVVEESTDDGVYSGKANVYFRNVLLGSLDWRIPAYLNQGENKSCEAGFTSESIDYVRVTPEERHILRSLGERFKIRLDLASGSDSMSVTSGDGEPTRELGERDHAAWRWSISNSGNRDTRLVLNASLINKDANEIALLQQERAVAASNVVRKVRGYLQPIPLAAGIVIGFVLFGIVGIFRRPKATMHDRRNPPADSGYMEKKQL